MTSFPDEPGAIRTHGLLLRRETLYPAELRAHSSVSYGRGKACVNSRSWKSYDMRYYINKLLI